MCLQGIQSDPISFKSALVEVESLFYQKQRELLSCQQKHRVFSDHLKINSDFFLMNHSIKCISYQLSPTIQYSDLVQKYPLVGYVSSLGRGSCSRHYWNIRSDIQPTSEEFVFYFLCYSLFVMREWNYPSSLFSLYFYNLTNHPLTSCISYQSMFHKIFLKSSWRFLLFHFWMNGKWLQ